ncbi:hypothetical protein [Halovulum marinum]|uniref:hypothetical protein n=1 Tax=Halovulum marinum TaxID=2662447 RepID=UPI0012B3C5AF|nr:hypothetical protein [Halovulum marinum]
MRTGWKISIGLHLAAIAAGLFVVPYQADRLRDVTRVTEVSIVTAPPGAQGQAPPPPEDAPPPPEAAPRVADTQVASIDAPEFSADAGPPPAADQAPSETVQDLIEDPSARDGEADLSALLEQVAQPEVAVDVDAPAESDTQPDAAPPAMAAPADSGLDNRTETPRGPQLAAPPAPRAAPRIADFTPPAPPSPPAQRDATPEASPDEIEQAAAQPPEPPAQAPESAPAPPSEQESGAEQGNALLRSTAPPARPRNFETQIAAAEQAREEQARAAEAERARRAAEEERRRAEAEAAAVAAAVSAAAEQPQSAPSSAPASAPPAAAAEVPQGPPLTAGEKDALRLAVQRCWNVPAGLANAEDLRVVVAVELAPDGRIIGAPRLIEPTSSSRPEIRVAFEAARRALLRCQAGGYQLPREKYAQWKNLEVAFDPEGMLSRW